MEKEKEVVVPETTEEVTPPTEEVTPTEEAEETVDWKAKAQKAEELANNYKVRAEKAERKAKESGKSEQKAESSDLTPKDTIALINAKVTETEDIDEVVEFAKFKKISISDALKSNTIKTLLSERAEQRRIALAANTGASRRTSVKATGEALIERASKGQLPESDEDIDKLTEARLNSRKARK